MKKFWILINLDFNYTTLLGVFRTWGESTWSTNVMLFIFFFPIKLIIDPKFLVPLFIWGPREGKDVAYPGAGPDALDACELWWQWEGSNAREVVLLNFSKEFTFEKVKQPMMTTLFRDLKAQKEFLSQHLMENLNEQNPFFFLFLFSLSWRREIWISNIEYLYWKHHKITIKLWDS